MIDFFTDDMKEARKAVIEARKGKCPLHVNAIELPECYCYFLGILDIIICVLKEKNIFVL